MPLVDLNLAIKFVRQDEGIEDDVIQVLLDAATQSAVDYLNRDVYEDDDALALAVTENRAGPHAMVINGAIRAAILKACAELYANREETYAATKIGKVPFNAQDLLRPHRIVQGV
ncbi:head-tail connector protein [Burkholderia sp. USMB20]|uniref:head-tail connector protein n=1 Tax=Burkholderia sp. USMB20 TaxID=1571773 RepID=UPI0005CEE04A|nr:head-tail connector protein [Burkholderia sp. USMB20]TGN96120.1 phage gp6-like head-tail connector protein [Burkholderia sp. USMB20]